MNDHPPIHLSQQLERCPYLQLHDDPKTSLAYPSPWNHCGRVKPPAAVSVSQQVKACLKKEYIYCEVYCAETIKEFPSSLRGKFDPVNKRKTASGYIVTWTVFILLSLVGVLFVFAGRQLDTNDALDGNVLGTPADKSKGNGPENFTPNVIPSNAMLLGLTPESTTYSTSRTCGYELDVVFGEKDRFVIHRIAIGENLDLYAVRFQTSTNAIVYINYEMQMPVWENVVIVIPVGTTLGIGLPLFETYEQERIKISVDDLAKRLNTTPHLFRKYNGFDETCSEFSGWMLIPHERNSP